MYVPVFTVSYQTTAIYDTNWKSVHFGGNDDGTRSYVIGIRKDIRARIGKQPGDAVSVEFECAQVDGPASLYLDALLAKVERKGRPLEKALRQA